MPRSKAPSPTPPERRSPAHASSPTTTLLASTLGSSLPPPVASTFPISFPATIGSPLAPLLLRVAHNPSNSAPARRCDFPSHFCQKPPQPRSRPKPHTQLPSTRAPRSLRQSRQRRPISCPLSRATFSILRF